MIPIPRYLFEFYSHIWGKEFVSKIWFPAPL
jgi:hypothetical protein